MAKSKRPSVQKIRGKLRAAFNDSGMTQEDVGVAMGYSKSGARKAVSRLLNPNVEYDPRLSTLLAFAKAIGRPLRDIM
jgi:transcriptional regulator with XRE-family HTH domain